MQYLSPDFIEAYKSAEVNQRKNMLRAVLEVWDAEYRSLISSGISPDTIWEIGNRQFSGIIGTSKTFG